MTAATPSKRSTSSTKLNALRKRLTLTVGLLVAVGLVVLAATATIVDSGLRSDRFREQQQGLASRAAALVFLDDEVGGWNVEGVIDDMVAAEADVLVIVTRNNGQELYRQGGAADVRDLVLRTFDDGAELGVTGLVQLDESDGALSGAGAPFFIGDQVEGAVVVASVSSADPDHRQFTTFVWSTTAALTLASLVGAWLFAGLALRPMGEAIDRETLFLATSAHELRTPLARSQAAAESTLLTARELPESAERATLVRELRRLVALTRASSADVNDLLLVGRIDADQLDQRMELVRLDTLVAGFEATVPELAVETTGPVEITADPILLGHALSNLFANAQRHGRLDDTPVLIEATVYAQGDVNVVTIRDNGTGLPATESGDIFERHMTTSGDGSGLGLWIVRYIVERSAGTIDVLEDSRGGACFRLQWPAQR